MTLTVAAAAERLGIGISTVRDAIRSGRLRHYRFDVGRESEARRRRVRFARKYGLI